MGANKKVSKPLLAGAGPFVPVSELFGAALATELVSPLPQGSFTYGGKV